MKVSTKTKLEMTKIPLLLNNLAKAAIAMAKDLLTTSESILEDVRKMEVDEE